MIFGEGAQVRYDIPLNYNNPNEGGGPIRRTPLLAVRIDAGNTIYRTPHQVVRDAEPGGAYEPQLWQDKFLPDGRIVPAGALGATSELQSRIINLGVWSVGGGALLGSLYAAVQAKRGKRVRAAGFGGLFGALGGLLIAGVAGRTAAVAGAWMKGQTA